jgi:H+/Cl- antiporter ClcA
MKDSSEITPRNKSTAERVAIACGCAFLAIFFGLYGVYIFSTGLSEEQAHQFWEKYAYPTTIFACLGILTIVGYFIAAGCDHNPLNQGD